MTTPGGRGIEDMLNLPHMDELLKSRGISHLDDEPTDLDDGMTENDEIAISQSRDLMAAAAQKLALVEGTDHASAMDVIYKETLQHSRELMDLAYNVDERSRRGILEIATAMYKNAIDAKNSKRDMQLKVMKLIQDQQKIDLDEKKWRAEMGEDVVETKAVITEDRNELIRRIRQQAKENEQPKDTPDA